MENKNMRILGIDTSCDDTCISLIKVKSQKSKIKNFDILSNIVSSQVKLHAKYGGVYPSLAKREHQRNLPIVLKKALKKANFSISNFKFLISKKNPNNKIQIPKIDLIAVTIGPGLEPCLWQGMNFARDLAEKFKKPLIPVNHIEAHILANYIRPNSKFKIQNSKFHFPAVCLVVSGGHTQLILMRNIGDYKILGETRDDAAGECFDKTARILGLGYPGGPIVAKMAANYKLKTINYKTKLPRPMMYTKDYDFSFSGLKTAVLYEVKSEKRKMKNENFIRAMAYEIQQAIIDVLLHKTLKAAKDFRAKSIILGGGVAANEELRRQFNWKLKIENWKLNFLVPPQKFCTDNGAMIALTAFFHREKATRNLKKIKANANFNI